MDRFTKTLTQNGRIMNQPQLQSRRSEVEFRREAIVKPTMALLWLGHGRYIAPLSPRLSKVVWPQLSQTTKGQPDTEAETEAEPLHTTRLAAIFAVRKIRTGSRHMIRLNCKRIVWSRH